MPEHFEYQQPLLPGSAACVPRARALRQALALLERGGFLTVCAPPHSGVTTFLYALRAKLPRSVFVDLANLSFADEPLREAARVLARLAAEATPGATLPADPASVADVLGAVAEHQGGEGAPHELLSVFVDGFDAWSDDHARKLVLAFRAAYTESRTRGSTRPGFSIVTGSAVDLRDLTASGRTSPLNIAQQLFLADFTEQESGELLGRGFAGHFGEPECAAWAGRILHWAAGHPAFTQVLGHFARELGAPGAPPDAAWAKVLDAAREQATGMLAGTLDVLGERAAVRRAAAEIYSGGEVPFDRIHRPVRELLHLGLIRGGDKGLCVPRNPLYERILAAALNLEAPRGSIDLWGATEHVGPAQAAFIETPPGSTTQPSPAPREGRMRPITSVPLPPPRSEKPAVAAGEVLGGCRVIRRIGRGAMGEVYLARHVALDTEVALKVLVHPAREDRRIAQRFLREARAAAQLGHPNIVQIHNVGREGEHLFIQMEYLPGGSLADQMRGGPCKEIARAQRWLRGAAAGIHAAHLKGVIHRDVKPDNLMLAEDGAVKVVDFGLAAIASVDGSRLTQEGTILGTPHYMAPEQWEGKIIDERSDVYSLGATFYHLLCGRPPFDAKTAVELIASFSKAELAPPELYNTAVPKALSKCVVRMLQKDREDRYGSLAELLEEAF